MFGTLVSTDIDQETLEFIENPDPIAAVSRNLQNKTHIACTFCRSRKAGCSGRRTGCQRCVMMGIECVYPESQRRNKRREDKTSCRSATKRNENSLSRMACNGAEQCARNNQAKHGFGLDDLHDKLCDDSDTDDSPLPPGAIDTPMQHSSDGGSSLSGFDNPTSAGELTTSESSYSAQSRGSVRVPPEQFLELSKTDTFLTSLLSPSAMDSAIDMDCWDRNHSIHGGDMTWAMSSGEDSTAVDSIVLSSPSMDTGFGGGKTRIEPDCCSCLMGSISFLEKLASRSASRENRIDLILTDVRTSIENLANFMACENCAARAELNMVLAMAARQIGILCGKLANCCKSMQLRPPTGGGDTSSSANSSPQQQQQKSNLGASSGTGLGEISVSTYRVDRREGLHLLKSLATFQIIEFQQHVNTIKSRCRHQPNQGQTGALLEAENYIELAQITISSHSP